MKLRHIVGFLLLIFAVINAQPSGAETLAEDILSRKFTPRDELAARDDIILAVGDSLRGGRFVELERLAELFRSDLRHRGLETLNDEPLAPEIKI